MIYKKGYTVSTFSEKSGINRTTLYYLFNGRTKKLRGDTCYKIADVLKIPYEEAVRITTEGL